MKVFLYGANEPLQNAELVDQQIRRAHRYYNVLIGHERDRRKATGAIFESLVPGLLLGYARAASNIRALPKAEANEKLAALLDQEVLRLEAGQAARFRRRAWQAEQDAKRAAQWTMSEDCFEEAAKAEEAAQDQETEEPSQKQPKTNWRLAEGATARAWELAWREWAAWREKLDAQSLPINEQASERARQERGRSGTFWGTYLCIEEAVKQAIKSTPASSRLSFRPWLGKGLVAVQIQGGMTSEELLEGKDTRARLLGSGRDRHLWIRVGSEGRSPVWAVTPIVYHRDLPPGAKIKWVRIHRGVVATHFTYSAQFVLDEPAGFVPVPPKLKAIGTFLSHVKASHPGNGTLPLSAATAPNAVGIDIGWRRFPEAGMRVAVWTDSAGSSGELRLPERLLTRQQKVEDLHSIRDKNFNVALKQLCDARRKATDWPAALMLETRHAHTWRAPSKLADLVTRWRISAASTSGRSPLAAFEEWQHQDRHLYEWEANQRENVLLARREIYRLFALQMATYPTVVIERLDLRDLAEHPGPNDRKEPEGIKAARGQRHFAAQSDLLGCIALAAGPALKEANPAKTTMIHNACGFESPVEPRAKLIHVCPGCGAKFDQDYNAALNILARGIGSGQIAPSKRAKAVVRNAQGKTAAEARHLRGLGTRRAKQTRRFTLTFICNGEDIEVAADPAAPLGSARDVALECSGNIGHHPREWNILATAGEQLSAISSPDSLGLTTGTRLILSLAAGTSG